MNIEIRKCKREDLAAIVRLMRDFAEFEKLSDYCEITEDKLAAVMFSESAFVEGLIAFDRDRPIAYSLFYPCFASFRGERGLYLEDIYIDGDNRGQGVGRKMLKQVAAIAHARGCVRIDFQVLNWNTPAINFYRELGAESNEDESHFKFSGEAFDLLAS